MENIINKIEKFQTDNKAMYAYAMEKDFKEIVFVFAELIGSMNYQLESIKSELETLKNK